MQPGSHYRWVVLAGGCVAQACFSAFFLGLPALAPAFRAEYHLGLAKTGLLLSSASVGIVVTLFPWGIAADRAGERIVIGWGLLAGGIALVGAAFASQFAVLLALLALAAAAGAGVNSGTGRAVMTWFAPGERGLALGIRQTAIPVAGATAAVILPRLAASHGLRAALLALAGTFIVGAAVGALLLRALHHQVEHAVETAPLALTDRRLWRLSGGSVLVCVAQLSLVGFVVLFLHDARGVGSGSAALVLAASQLVGAAFRLSGGVWSDRLGRRIDPIRYFAVALTVTLAAATALSHASLWLLVPTLVLATGLSMGWNSLSFAAAAELGGAARSGAAIGIQQTALALASVLVPILFALTVERTSWQAAFAVAALFPLAGWWILRPLGEGRPRPSAP
jgi:MFS family permease